MVDIAANEGYLNTTLKVCVHYRSKYSENKVKIKGE